MSEHSNGTAGLVPEARRPSNGHTPWGRQGGASEERVTSRQRRMAVGLPSWDPLPPGEVLIRRPSQS